MTANWRSYDDIAETYARVAEQPCFAQPARELLELLAPTPGSRLLDVGAGTGAVSGLASTIVGPTGLVIALDPSLAMLNVLRGRCNARAVAGELPGLPLPDCAFDAVAAAFVLTHMSDCASALAAMTQVLRPGGRLGISAWALSEAHTPPGQAWQAVALEFVDTAQLQETLREALPLQDRFAEPAFLETLLAGAGLARVQVREITVPVEMRVQAFAELRQISMSGRWMRTVLSPGKWARFKEKSARSLAEQYGETVSFEMRANLAVGSKRPD